MPIEPALLDSANRWFDISWYGLLISGTATAVAATATVGFLYIQFWSSGVREQQADWRTSNLEIEAEKAQAILQTANAEIESQKTEQDRLRLALEEAKAETLRLSRGLASRHISLAQRALISSVLRGTSQRIDVISMSGGNAEVDTYCNEITDAFRAAGWQAGTGSDVRIPAPYGITLLEAVNRVHSPIAKALTAANIEYDFRQADIPNAILRVGIKKPSF